MALTEKARANHDKLLSNYQSALQGTDPEFIENFDNFAFDQVLSNSTLDDRSRMLITLASLIANRSLAEYKIMLVGAMNLGVTPVEMKEVLYQSLAYVGLAVSFGFFEATNSFLREKGIKLPLQKQNTVAYENQLEKGLDKMYEIFGKDFIDAMRESFPGDQKHFMDFIQGYCFGGYYTRSGLSVQNRELISFAFLASLGGCEAELRPHTQGNLNVGNDRKTLISAITVLCPYIGFPKTLNALAIVNEICGK